MSYAEMKRDCVKAIRQVLGEKYRGTIGPSYANPSRDRKTLSVKVVTSTMLTDQQCEQVFEQLVCFGYGELVLRVKAGVARGEIMRMRGDERVVMEVPEPKVMVRFLL